MKTKHEVYNCDKCSSKLRTSMKVLKHFAKCQERGQRGEGVRLPVVMMGGCRGEGGHSEGACGHNYFGRKIIEGSNEYFF